MNISDIHENRNENIALFKQKSETSKPYSIKYILVDPGTTFQSTYQIWGTGLQLMSRLVLQQGLGVSTPFLITYNFPLFPF